MFNYCKYVISNRPDTIKYKRETKIFVSNVLRDVCENLAFKLVSMMKFLKCNKIHENHFDALFSNLCIDLNN
jgi:hypothetical protein